MSCPQKFKYRWIDRLKPKTKSKALALGGHMADAIAVFREGKSRDDVLHAFMESWKAGGEVLDLDRDEDPKRSVPRALEILSNYMDEHADEPDMVVMPEVRVEQEFFLPDGLQFIWRGRIDSVMQIDNDITIVEDKTASMWGPSSFNDLQDSFQVMSYLKIAKDRDLFEKIPKILLNVIYIHATKFHGSGEPRRIIRKFNRDIDATWDTICAWVRQIEMMRTANHFPGADSKICNMYGGCEYLPLKFATPEQREILMRTEFEREED